MNTILLVEDDETLNSNISLALRSEGYTVIAVSTTAAAELHAPEADLIILGGNEAEGEKHHVKRNVLSTDQSEVLAHSKCPVMIIQKPDIEKIFKIF